MVPALLGLVSKVGTLLDRLTSTRAGYLDRLDAAISSRAAASVWTSTVAGRIDAAISSRAAAPTIQTNWISTTGVGTSTGEDAYYVNVTITEVSGTTNCVVLAQGSLHDVTARLINATTLRLSCRALASGNTISARWTVIDYGG